MIVNVRGCSGSGKSTVVRQWLKDYPMRPLYGVFGSRRPQAYECIVPGLKHPLYILGSYETVCGGCDTIQPYALILDLLRKYAHRGHVLFEGLLVGHSYGSVGALLDQLATQGVASVIILLATPVAECVARVRQRRLRRGDTRPFNPKNLITAHASCLKAKQRFRQTNSPVPWIELACEQVNARVLQLLKTTD